MLSLKIRYGTGRPPDVFQYWLHSEQVPKMGLADFQIVTCPKMSCPGWAAEGGVSCLDTLMDLFLLLLGASMALRTER